MKVLIICAAMACGVMVTACGGNAGMASAHHVEKHVASYVDPACTSVLAQLPAQAPATAAQAGVVVRGLSVDQGVLAPVPKGTLLWSLATDVASDALKLTFDLSGLRNNASGDLTVYNSAVVQLRHYCLTGS
jgi:hypothetical protein